MTRDESERVQQSTMNGGKSPVVRWVALAIAISVLLSLTVLSILKLRTSGQLSIDSSPKGKSGVETVAAEPLTGVVHVRLWNSSQDDRQNVLISPRTTPLRDGDQIRIEVNMSQPRYLYLLWIEADNVPRPVYPWSLGDWDQRPAVEPTVDTLQLPEEAMGWSVTGPSGIDTVVLMARETPLPNAVDLRDVLAGLKFPEMKDSQANLLVEDGIPTQVRGIKLRASAAAFKSVAELQRQLSRRLDEHFTWVRVLSFSNSVEEVPPSFDEDPS
jgi:hypothetical protein